MRFIYSQKIIIFLSIYCYHRPSVTDNKNIFHFFLLLFKLCTTISFKTYMLVKKIRVKILN